MLPSLRTGTRHSGAHNQHSRSPKQEADIPEDALSFRHGLVHLVEPEDLMIYHAFDQIEDSPPKQHRAETLLARPLKIGPAGSLPQQIQAEEHEHVGDAVKDAVPGCVEIDVVDGIQRVP